MVGGEYFHGFIGGGEHGAGCHDGLVVVELHVDGGVGGGFEEFDVAADFVDFVFVVCEDVGDLLFFGEVDEGGNDFVSFGCIEEDQRDGKIGKLRLHELEIFEDEVGASWRGAVPGELRHTVDVACYERDARGLSELGSSIESTIVVDAKVLGPEPMKDSCG